MGSKKHTEFICWHSISTIYRFNEWNGCHMSYSKCVLKYQISSSYHLHRLHCSLSHKIFFLRTLLNVIFLSQFKWCSIYCYCCCLFDVKIKYSSTICLCYEFLPFYYTHVAPTNYVKPKKKYKSPNSLLVNNNLLFIVIWINSKSQISEFFQL